MRRDLKIWGGFFIAQLLVVLEIPHHTPGATALGLGFVFFLVSFPRALAPRNKTVAGFARCFFLVFVAAFGWEIVVALTSVSIPVGLSTALLLALLTLPTWLLNGFFPRGGLDVGRTDRQSAL